MAYHGRLPLSQNVRLEILEILRLKWKTLFSSRSKLAISLVDQTERTWCNGARRQQNGEGIFCSWHDWNDNLFPFQQSGTDKNTSKGISGSGKCTFDPRVLFEFEPVKSNMMTKWKTLPRAKKKYIPQTILTCINLHGREQGSLSNDDGDGDGDGNENVTKQ